MHWVRAQVPPILARMDGNLTHQKGAGSPAGGRKPNRMRPQLRAAIDEIVWKGRTQREAARRAGLNESALGRALQRPEVAAFLEQQKALATLDALKLKEQAKAIAIREGIDLMVSAQSEQVRARMVEFFAGEARQALVNVHVGAQQEPATGYRYRRPDQPATDRTSDVEYAQVVDVQAQSPDVGE